MTAPYYIKTGSPGTGTFGFSSTIRAEFSAIDAAFALLPTFSGNSLQPLRINAGETAIEAASSFTLSALTLDHTASTALALVRGAQAFNLYIDGAGDAIFYDTTNTLSLFTLASTGLVSNVGFEVLGTDAVDLTDDSVAFKVGPGGGQHIEIDDYQIQSKINATTQSSLSVNRLGGTVDIGPQSGTGVVNLYNAGILMLGTGAAGVTVNAATLVLDNPAASAAKMYVKNDEGGVALEADTDAFRIVQTDAAGADEATWVAGTNDGEVTLYHNNVLKARTKVAGFDVEGTELRIANTAATTTILQILNSAYGMQMWLATTTGTTNIGQTNAGGTTEDTWITMARDGAVSLYNNDSVALSTTSLGIDVVGTTAQIVASTDVNTSLKIRNSTSGMLVYLSAPAGSGVIRQADSAGNNDDLWIVMLRNASVSLYYDGVSKLSTALETSYGTGALVVDGGGVSRPVGLNVTPITTVSASTSLRMANGSHALHVTTASIAVDVDTTTDSSINGTRWTIMNQSGGSISLTGTGVTLSWFTGAAVSTGTRTIANGGFVEVIKRGASQYIVIGNGLT